MERLVQTQRCDRNLYTLMQDFDGQDKIAVLPLRLADLGQIYIKQKVINRFSSIASDPLVSRLVKTANNPYTLQYQMLSMTSQSLQKTLEKWHSQGSLFRFYEKAENSLLKKIYNKDCQYERFVELQDCKITMGVN